MRVTVKDAIACSCVVISVAVAACTNAPPPKQPSKLIEVESESMLGATIMATMQCTGDKTMAVRLVAENGAKRTFECFEVDE